MHVPPRLLKVIKLLTEGKTLKEAAFELNLTYLTAKEYLSTVRKYTKCRTTEHLVARYLTEGWGISYEGGGGI